MNLLLKPTFLLFVTLLLIAILDDTSAFSFDKFKDHQKSKTEVYEKPKKENSRSLGRRISDTFGKTKSKVSKWFSNIKTHGSSTGHSHGTTGHSHGTAGHSHGTTGHSHGTTGHRHGTTGHRSSSNREQILNATRRLTSTATKVLINYALKPYKDQSQSQSTTPKPKKHHHHHHHHQSNHSKSEYYYQSSDPYRNKSSMNDTNHHSKSKYYYYQSSDPYRNSSSMNDTDSRIYSFAITHTSLVPDSEVAASTALCGMTLCSDSVGYPLEEISKAIDRVLFIYKNEDNNNIKKLKNNGLSKRDFVSKLDDFWYNKQTPDYRFVDNTTNCGEHVSTQYPLEGSTEHGHRYYIVNVPSLKQGITRIECESTYQMCPKTTGKVKEVKQCRQMYRFELLLAVPYGKSSYDIKDFELKKFHVPTGCACIVSK